MGKLNIYFTKNGEVVTPGVNSDFKTTAEIQYVSRKYNLHLLKSLNLSSEDFEISLDIDAAKESIDWISLDFPNEIAKNEILDYIYYLGVAEKLRRINQEIARCGFSERYTIESKAREAIQVISNIENRNSSNKDISIDKSVKISELHHTLGKEVSWLLNTGHRESDKRKQEALYDAVNQLTSEINRFILTLEYVEK